ncbi:sigma-54 interaction domain-containing protein, partial [Sporomusa sp.]|uniref:sigma-54 interaction domain-containing protein n=1 Tax=Sporomusa sp. TaxID=2078658 RepID=UPI002B679798
HYIPVMIYYFFYDERKFCMSNLQDQITELKKRNKLYEEILDMMFPSICIDDMNGEIVWLNHVMMEVLRDFETLGDVDRSDVVGQKVDKVIQDFDFKNSTLAYTRKSGNRSDEHFVLSTDNTGRQVVHTMQTYPFYYAGKLEYIYTLGYLIDLYEKEFNRFSEYRRKLLLDKTKNLGDTHFTLYDIVGGSQKIKELIALSRQAALTNSPILLYGETGTGKELFAQGIHNASLCNKGRFVAVNCAAIPESLIETILFGSKKGAFTGALDKPGIFEDATNGTVFLDELDSLPLSTQGKLLRVLQEKQTYRIGDTQNYPINCRILSATNREPRQLVENGLLRQDLYYRLAVVVLEIPPLVDRENDITELANHFIQKFNQEFKRQITHIDDDVLTAFYGYSWPGNVRELEHIIEQMMIFTNYPQKNLSLDNLPQYFKKLFTIQHQDSKDDLEDSLHQSLENFEKKILAKTLMQTQWNISQAARKLGIHREALHYRINKFGLKK